MKHFNLLDRVLKEIGVEWKNVREIRHVSRGTWTVPVAYPDEQFIMHKEIINLKNYGYDLKMGYGERSKKVVIADEEID
jgi:hypothetical protein